MNHKKQNNTKKRKQNRSPFNKNKKSRKNPPETLNIPKAKLDAALKLLNADAPPKSTGLKNEKQRTKCTVRVNAEHDDKNLKFAPESLSRVLKELHNCLLNQNWKYIAEIIEYGLFKIEYTHHETALIKYSLIALMYDPRAKNTELLKSFIQGVISCQDSDLFLRYLFKSHNKIDFKLKMSEQKKKKSVDEDKK